MWIGRSLWVGRCGVGCRGSVTVGRSLWIGRCGSVGCCGLFAVGWLLCLVRYGVGYFETIAVGWLLCRKLTVRIAVGKIFAKKISLRGRRYLFTSTKSPGRRRASSWLSNWIRVTGVMPSRPGTAFNHSLCLLISAETSC